MLLMIMLAISLSIDALGIGLSYGLRGICTPFLTKCILLLESMAFMAVFLFAGSRLMLLFSAHTANLIGVLLLLGMGLWLCYQSLQKKEPSDSSLNLLRNPSYCDKDHSSHIDAREGLSLGLILSIDSMGAGIGAGAAGVCITLLPLFTALFQILFLSLGIYGGKHFKKYCHIKESIWTALSGCILISIALLRYLFS